MEGDELHDEHNVQVQQQLDEQEAKRIAWADVQLDDTYVVEGLSEVAHDAQAMSLGDELRDSVEDNEVQHVDQPDAVESLESSEGGSKRQRARQERRRKWLPRACRIRASLTTPSPRSSLAPPRLR